MLKEWKRWVNKIAISAREIISEVEVFVFGSAVRGELTGGSDVDILIISNNLPERNIDRSKVKAKIEERANLPFCHPFEIHLVNNEEASFYFKHVKDDYERIL
jgi:hypothetical protein